MNLQKANLLNLLKNQLGRSIVTDAAAGRDNDDVSMIHPMNGWIVEQNPLILSLHKNKKDGISKILPTRIGSYSHVLNGTIQNQPISDEVQIEDVESKQKISFPEANIGGGW
jgi:hypothetical protein